MGDPWRFQGYGAAACKVGTAIHTLEGEVKNGVFTERTTNITPMPLNNDWTSRYGHPDLIAEVASAIDIECLNSVERLSLQKDNYTIPNDTNWMTYDVAYPANLAYLRPTAGDPATFTVGQSRAREDNFGFENATLLAELNGTEWRRYNYTDIRPECIYQSSTVDLLALFGEFDDSIIGSIALSGSAEPVPNKNNSALIEALYQDYGNISANSLQEAMDNMFHVMDVQRRNVQKNGEGTQTVDKNFAVTGTVLRNETCVSISWPWLAFPAAMNILTIIFMLLLLRKQFVSAKWQGDPLTQHGYKTAVVPLLLHGLGPGRSGGGGEDETTKEKEKRLEGGKWFSRKGEDVFVRFEGKGADWRLVEVQRDTHEDSGGTTCIRD